LIFICLLINFNFLVENCRNDGREFGGSIYQRCSDRLETGVQLSWASGSNQTKFGVAAKYDLDKDACVRAKVNNSSQIGLGYQQKLRDGEYSWKFLCLFRGPNLIA
jgi:voltage-dependent anion channel protein 2